VWKRIYDGKDLWNRCVLSLEWKREEVMDGESGGDVVDGMNSEDVSKDR